MTSRVIQRQNFETVSHKQRDKVYLVHQCDNVTNVSCHLSTFFFDNTLFHRALLFNITTRDSI